jgi:D-methionine transport system substrate-binding protein
MMKKNIIKSMILVGVLAAFLTGCGSKEQELKISATSVPHAEVLEFIKDDLKAEGINLNIIVSDEYTLHNRMLSEKEIDANYFQHFPYLEAQVNDFGYDIESIAKVHIEPLGLYSKTITSLDELADGATIAVPNDESNEARALALLHNNGIIQVDDVTSSNLTILNIVENPKNLNFYEIDAAMLARTLEDVDAAVINTNFALQANLSPLEDAIIMEDADSPFVNIVAARSEDVNREDLKKLVEILMSDKVRTFFEETYGGSIVPVF